MHIIDEFPSQLAFAKRPMVRADSVEPQTHYDRSRKDIMNFIKNQNLQSATNTNDNGNDNNNMNINNNGGHHNTGQDSFNINDDTNSTNESIASSPMFNYEPKHFVQSTLHFPSPVHKNGNKNEDRNEEISSNEFARQLSLQNGDKNRETQARYYNRDKSKDPFENVEKVKFRFGRKIVPSGDYCLKNLGLLPNRPGEYNLGDGNDASVVAIDADYMIRAENSCSFVNVCRFELCSILMETENYSVYKKRVVDYLDDVCSVPKDDDDI